MNIVELLWHASLLIKLVLLALILLSVFSWTVIIYKEYALRRAAGESARFLEAFESGAGSAELQKLSGEMSASPLANIYAYLSTLKSGMQRDRLRGAMNRAIDREAARLDAYLTFLASTGSTAPFIGLFGTVWGIINAFKRIGEVGSASLAVVAPGIAEALVTTAAGLAVAIPAVVAYNYFGNKTRQMTSEMESLSEDLLGVAGRRPA